MSAPDSFRSAVPLAAAGIVTLGLVPTLGDPGRPLHWATTAGMVGFGVLLLTRRRLHGAEGPLESVTPEAARSAGRALLVICAVVTALVGVIIGFRVANGRGIAPLSLAMPTVGLVWLASLGIKARRYKPPAVEAVPDERASRRPSSWDGISNRGSTHPSPPDRQVNA